MDNAVGRASSATPRTRTDSGHPGMPLLVRIFDRVSLFGLTPGPSSSVGLCDVTNERTSRILRCQVMTSSKPFNVHQETRWRMCIVAGGFAIRLIAVQVRVGRQSWCPCMRVVASQAISQTAHRSFPLCLCIQHLQVHRIY